MSPDLADTLWGDALQAREQFRDLHRVDDATGSTVEPPLDDGWDEITKLRWHAAVTEHDTGIRIIVTGPYRQRRYSLNVGRYSVGSTDYDTCWTYLNGVRTGAQAAKELA